jgi:hypothetical protein
VCARACVRPRVRVRMCLVCAVRGGPRAVSGGRRRPREPPPLDLWLDYSSVSLQAVTTICDRFSLYRLYGMCKLCSVYDL